MRVSRTSTSRQLLNENFVADQGRSRGAARPRPDLHERRADADRPRRLADVGLSDARLQPFYGGTYWPQTARGGMPGFDQVLEAVASTPGASGAANRPPQAAELTKQLQTARIPARPAILPRRGRSGCCAWPRRRWNASFDPHHGGFGGRRNFRIRWICGCCCASGGAAGNLRLPGTAWNTPARDRATTMPC